MSTSDPSRASETSDVTNTAVLAAGMRARHLLLDEGPTVHRDRWALPLTSWTLAELRARVEEGVLSGSTAPWVLRAQLVDDLIEHRYKSAGLRQVVQLGVGLETLAVRLGPHMPELRVFELDTAAALELRQERFDAVGLRPSRTQIGVDLAVATPGKGLGELGWSEAEPTVFLALGLVMYLPTASVSALFRWFAQLKSPSTLVFTYLDAGVQILNDKTGGPAQSESAHPAFKVTPMTRREVATLVRDAGIRHRRHVSWDWLSARYYGSEPPTDLSAQRERIAILENETPGPDELSDPSRPR